MHPVLLYALGAFGFAVSGMASIFYSYYLDTKQDENDDLGFIGKAYRGMSFFFGGVMGLLFAIILIVEAVKAYPI